MSAEMTSFWKMLKHEQKRMKNETNYNCKQHQHTLMILIACLGLGWLGWAGLAGPGLAWLGLGWAWLA